MGKKVATLTSAGYIDGVAEKAENAMLNFFYSRGHQSFIFGELAPLGTLVTRYGNDETAFEKEVKIALTTHLKDDFNNVSLTATSELAPDGGINLKLNVILIEDGSEHSLAYLILTKSALLLDILEISNGEPMSLAAKRVGYV